MIVAFSTSSPWASVALLDESGEVLWEGMEEAPRRASEACLTQLDRACQETGMSLETASLFVADIGPGSFTGVRVGIVMAKTFAWAYGAKCAGADCFDLISPDQTVLVPSKKAEWFVRVPGNAPFRSTVVPEGIHVGFGFGGEDLPPRASRFANLLGKLTLVTPESFAPEYLMEPSISVPKKPYRTAQTGAQSG